MCAQDVINDMHNWITPLPKKKTDYKTSKSKHNLTFKRLNVNLELIIIYFKTIYAKMTTQNKIFIFNIHLPLCLH